MNKAQQAKEFLDSCESAEMAILFLRAAIYGSRGDDAPGLQRMLDYLELAAGEAHVLDASRAEVKP